MPWIALKWRKKVLVLNKWCFLKACPWTCQLQGQVTCCRVRCWVPFYHPTSHHRAKCKAPAYLCSALSVVRSWVRPGIWNATIRCATKPPFSLVTCVAAPTIAMTTCRNTFEINMALGSSWLVQLAGDHSVLELLWRSMPPSAILQKWLSEVLHGSFWMTAPCWQGKRCRRDGLYFCTELYEKRLWRWAHQCWVPPPPPPPPPIWFWGWVLYNGV